jgi:hypothetical protein
MSVLIDTPVWSLLFRRDQRKLNSREIRAVEDLRRIVHDNRARVIGPIRQELLSGIRHVDQFERLQHRFRDFEDEPLTTADYEFAAEINCKCRRMGISMGAVDAVICSVACSRGWEIFTFDKDFTRYSRAQKLRIYKFSGA